MGERVLVVDNEKEVSNFLVSFLKRRNIKVFSATSAATAVEIYKKEKPNVVLLDIVMPDMDGLTLLQRLKAIDSGPHIGMLTSRKSSVVIAEVKKLGAEVFLSKPVELSEIDKVIKGFLGRDRV
ncbi:MAG: response regulator [Candidatus Omnitrophica bacterium]|nr:response regulator [Candidatus Omnitrophota bacterium]